jgi:hypothetical protein
MSSSINAVLGCLQTPLPHPESTAAAQISKCQAHATETREAPPTTPASAGRENTPIATLSDPPAEPGYVPVRCTDSDISHHITSHHILSRTFGESGGVCIAAALRLHCLRVLRFNYKALVSALL